MLHHEGFIGIDCQIEISFRVNWLRTNFLSPLKNANGFNDCLIMKKYSYFGLASAVKIKLHRYIPPFLRYDCGVFF